MSATVTTHHASHRVRAPWMAAAAVAAVIAGAGAVSLAIGTSGDSTSDQAPVLRTPTLQDYAQYNFLHGPRESFGGLDGHTPPTVKGGDGQSQGGSSSPATTSGGQTQIGQ
jgi:hypothetical protein